MLRYRIPHLPCPQPVSIHPFKFDRRFTTIRFDLGAVLSLEHRLPRQVYSASVIPHIHDFLAGETLADFRINGCVNLAAVGDGGLPALLRRLIAVEPDLHWPSDAIRKLVMHRDGLFWGIFRGGIDIFPYLGAGSRPLMVFHGS